LDGGGVFGGGVFVGGAGVFVGGVYVGVGLSLRMASSFGSGKSLSGTPSSASFM